MHGVNLLYDVLCYKDKTPPRLALAIQKPHPRHDAIEDHLKTLLLDVTDDGHLPLGPSKGEVEGPLGVHQDQVVLHRQ